MQTLRSLHIDLSSTSPSGSIQTTTTPLDCASPAYYWTSTSGPGLSPVATTMTAGATTSGGRSGSFRRPHPCSIPATQSTYKRLPQRLVSTSSSYSSTTASPSMTTQLLYASAFDDGVTTVAMEQSRSQLPAIQDGYLETDVWFLCWCCDSFVSVIEV
jgi:hypothetical protein